MYYAYTIIKVWFYSIWIHAHYDKVNLTSGGQIWPLNKLDKSIRVQIPNE